MVLDNQVSMDAARMSRRVSAMLADPIVQALMAADRIDRASIEALLSRIAARLADRAISNREGSPW
jgi:hypothetical protein